MTLSSDTAKIRHAGNGATYQFSTGFAFLLNSHVRVILLDAGMSETEWVENTHYTLTGANTGSPGQVTVLTAPTDYTPATGETLVIMRDVPFTQDLDANTLSTIAASNQEEALDKIWMAIGQLNERLSRALVSADSEAAGTVPDVTAWSPTFAIVSDGTRRVQQVVDWVGGAGTKPDTGLYVGSGGLVADIANAVDIRGAPGASGSGTGDMLAANNLDDVVDVPTARSNLGLGTAAVAAASDFLKVANDLDDLNDAATARSNLGLGVAATFADTDFLQAANNLSDLGSVASARTALGMGTAALLDVGTTANKVVQLNASAQLPAVSGALLTNLPNTGQPVPSTSTLAVGTVTKAWYYNGGSGGTLADGASVAGSVLYRVGVAAASSSGGAAITLDNSLSSGGAMAGTWKHITGYTIGAGTGFAEGLFVRTA